MIFARIKHRRDIRDIDLPYVEKTPFLSRYAETLSGYELSDLYRKVSPYSHDVGISRDEKIKAIDNALKSGELFIVHTFDPPSHAVVTWGGEKWRSNLASYDAGGFLVDTLLPSLNARNLTPKEVSLRRRGVYPSRPAPSPPPPEPVLTPEPPVPDPLPPRVFAHSRRVGWGCADAGTECESSTYSGTALYLAGKSGDDDQAFLQPPRIGVQTRNRLATLGSWRAAGFAPAVPAVATGLEAAGVASAATALAGVVTGNADDRIEAVGRFLDTGPGRAYLHLLAFLPGGYSDGTLLTTDQIRRMSEAPTRVRFSIQTLADGSTQIAGFHVRQGTPAEMVPVRQVQWSADKTYLEAHLNGITLTWTPNDGPLQEQLSPLPSADTHLLNGIMVYPVADEASQATTTEYPALPQDWNDAILIFPEDVRAEAIYIVFKVEPRNEAGTATGQGEEVTGRWLEQTSQELGAPIPAQIADRLRGREFSTFADFRRAFWMEVANDPTLSEQFILPNRIIMADGKSPYTISSERVGGRERFEIHHTHEIQHGGAVYDMDNLRVMTPRQHIDIHRTRR